MFTSSFKIKDTPLWVRVSLIHENISIRPWPLSTYEGWWAFDQYPFLFSFFFSRSTNQLNFRWISRLSFERSNICICGRSWLRADLSLNLTLYERRDFLWRFRTSLISIPFSFYLTIHIHLSPVLSVRFNFHEFKLLRYFYSIYFPSIVLYFISSSLYSI